MVEVDVRGGRNIVKLVLNIVCEDCTIYFIFASVLLSEHCWYQGGSDRGGVISWPGPGQRDTMEANSTIQHILNSLLEFISYWTQDLLHRFTPRLCINVVIMFPVTIIAMSTKQQLYVLKLFCPQFMGKFTFLCLILGLK